MTERGYKTIKELVFDIICQTEGQVDEETITAAVRRYFPKSKWKHSHWLYYRNQISNDTGRYRNDFPDDIRGNLKLKVTKGRTLKLREVDSQGRAGVGLQKEKVKRVGDAVLHHVRFIIDMAAGSDEVIRFKLNRWVYGRLQQDEIQQKRPVKQELWDSGVRSCQRCGKEFESIKGVEIHRKDREKIYSVENCELLCRQCHQKE